MRQSILFDDNWLFHRGDVAWPPMSQKNESVFPNTAYTFAKTERMTCGPASVGYPERANRQVSNTLTGLELWEDVSLPHDYVVQGEPKECYNRGMGYLKHENAWYRKHFPLPKEYEGKRVVLYFEGAANLATVWVNGCLLKRSFSGYTPFEVDITDVARYGEENVIAMYVDASSEMEGWWYEGGGIYRHVWLQVLDPVRVERYGVYVHPEYIGHDSWNTLVDVDLCCEQSGKTEICVQADVLDGETVIACAKTNTVCQRDEKAHVQLCCPVESPRRWDVDDPNLYTVRVTLLCGDEAVDAQEVRFGYRTFRFDPDHGFFLNERPLKIKGLCMHQDYGLTGKSVPERVQRYKLELIKEMGANGLRTAHYPHHEYTLDASDELGLIVMDECRWFESSEENLHQLQTLILRDRNHPSIFMWSIGNEEPFMVTPAGGRIAKSMMKVIRRLDPSRPVTVAQNIRPHESTVFEEIDLAGVNYCYHLYEETHERWPDKCYIHAECGGVQTTRGWAYADDARRGRWQPFDRGMDEVFNCLWFSRENTWKACMEREWVSGVYYWDAIEHRGEATWPRVCSASGMIDLFLQKKDAFYQGQAQFLDRPVLHLFPHWNLSGQEGMPVTVWAYTNCDRVQLFLNGAEVADSPIEKWGHGDWRVVYQPGELKAVGWQNGEKVIETVLQTTDPAKKLRLTLERGPEKADGRDVAIITCDCVDAQGRHVPDAAPMLHFMANELGVIVGTGSDNTDHTPVASPDRQMFMGYASALVRVGKKPGVLSVCVTADGLEGARLDIPLQEC